MMSPLPILVRVAPRLFGEALCVALRTRGLPVVFASADDPSAVDGRRFDVALVSEGLSAGVMGDTILVLGASGSTVSISGSQFIWNLARDDAISELVGLLHRLRLPGSAMAG